MNELITKLCENIDSLPLLEKVNALNQVRTALHEISPFKNEPVDLITWVPNRVVYANDYNPNSVAPPEMKLLQLSISEDGYTQPIVTMKTENGNEVVDGFHRHRVGKEVAEVCKRVMGFLPVVQIRDDRTDKSDRIAATIRHNRARGKHSVTKMSEIIVDLKKRNWSDDKIAKSLGMDADEVLRLSQISGLSEMFSDVDFSQAWEANSINENDSLSILEE